MSAYLYTVDMPGRMVSGAFTAAAGDNLIEALYHALGLPPGIHIDGLHIRALELLDEVDSNEPQAVTEDGTRNDELCDGCALQQPNQEAHMGPGGCLATE